MLTLNEANALANQIAGVWELGEVEDLEALYHSNVEGYFNNKVFYFKDIGNRMKKMNACCHKKNF